MSTPTQTTAEQPTALARRPGGLTEAQLALRRTGISGSEVGAVLNLSPWSKPIDVWAAKVEGRELEETEPMRRGRILEPAVAAWYAEDTGAELRECGTIRHPSSSVLMATPDRIARFAGGEERVVELKTAGFRMADRWGESGTDQVPSFYLLQTAAEMACAQLDRADLAVLIAGDDFRIYPLTRDPELEAMIIEACERFHRDYVLTRKPPPPDASDSYSEWLHARYSYAGETLLQADTEAEKWAQALFQARADKEDSETREKLARQHLENAIGSSYGMQGAGWKITWGETKGKPSINWEAIAKEAQIAPSLIAQHTKRQGYRQFRPTLDKAAKKGGK